MINFKSPYDSTQIREGLMNIKQSQMELLNQLKNQNHILRKYTPDNPIFQQKSDSNLYQTSSPGYSYKDNYQSRMASNQRLNYGPSSSYLSSNQKDLQENNFKFGSPIKHSANQGLEKELQTMTEDFHRMKKNYFTQKQKNKDMILHMQFAASLHNIILKEILQGNNLQNIRSKVRNQVQSYQTQFPEFKAFGLEQAFNIINLQSDSSFIQSRTPRRTPIFPPKPQQQNAELLKQLNDLKSELRQLSLEKERKSEQVILTKSESDYTVSLLNKEIQMKNGKINELVSQIIRQKESLKNLSQQNNDLKTNVDRLKSQLQRNLNKIQVLQNFQRKTTQTIQKQHNYVKYVKQLQDKITFLDKETKQKSKLIEIHQQNVNKSNQMSRSLKTDNEKLNSQISQLKQSVQKKSLLIAQLQKKLQTLQQSHTQQLTLINKRNQTEQASLKQHISQLKKTIDQFLKQQESYKLSQQTLQQIKQRKVQTLKFSKAVDHLWKIKEVEYQNINQVLTQLNLIKAQDQKSNSQKFINSNPSQERNYTKKQPSSSRKSKQKISLSEKQKSQNKNKNF